MSHSFNGQLIWGVDIRWAILPVAIAFSVTSLACTTAPSVTRASTAIVTSTPNTDVEGTVAAQVQATVLAMAPAATETPSPTETAVPTATPSPLPEDATATAEAIAASAAATEEARHQEATATAERRLAQEAAAAETAQAMSEMATATAQAREEEEEAAAQARAVAGTATAEARQASEAATAEAQRQAQATAEASIQTVDQVFAEWNSKTEIQREPFEKSMVGTPVIGNCTVREVQSSGTIIADCRESLDSAVYLEGMAKDTAAKFNKGDAIKFRGKIKRLTLFLFKYMYIDNIVLRP